MTVTFDAVGNLGTAHSTSGLSGSFTLGGSATALCVAVGAYLADSGFTSFDYTNLSTWTVKVGTTPLVRLGVIDCNNANGNGWVELWGLIGPPTGAQTITVVENNSTTPAFLNATAISFAGVSQFGTTVTHTGSGSSVTSGSIVSSTGSRVLTVVGAENSTLTLTGGGTQRSDMPATHTANYVTLLVQDQAGAATVSNTATYSSNDSLGWGTLSVNLVAGSRWTAAANAAMALGKSATASFVGAVWSGGANPRSMTLTAAASATAQPLGPALRYVGRPPDTASAISTAAYAQQDQQAFLVTPAWVTQQITQATANLVTSTWIDEQVANYATQTQVQSALSGYLPTTALGTTVAQLGTDGYVPSGQLSTVTTNSVATSYNVTGPQGTVFLPPGQQFVTQTSNLGELKLGTIDIPDPGYPYIVFPFAWVMGWSGSSPSGNPLFGNGNTGVLTVTPVGQTTPLYGVGLCTADTVPNFYACTPCAVPPQSATVTPSNQPPIIGEITLELSACNWTGADYTFSGTGMVFFVLIAPGLTGS